MAVTYYQLNKSTTSIPATSGTTTYVDGFYGVNGTLEYLICEMDLECGGTVARTTDLSALIKSSKIVIWRLAAFHFQIFPLIKIKIIYRLNNFI